MKKNFVYFLLPSIIMGGLATTVMVPITTYYLDPEDFGIFALLTSLTMPIGPLSSTGVTWVLAGNYHHTDTEEKKVLFFNLLFVDLLLKIFWVAVFWGLSPYLLPILVKEFRPEYLMYFRLSLGSILLSMFWPSVSYLLVLQQRGLPHAIIETVPWILGCAATILCLTYFQIKTVSLFVAPVVSGLVLLILCLLFARTNVIVSLKKRWLLEIFRIGLPTIPMNLFEMIRTVLDRLFIQRWLSLAYLGIYSHSLSYKNMYTAGTKAFSRSFSPLAIETFSLQHEPEQLSRKLNKWYCVLGVVGICIAFFADDAIRILTHGKFTEAAILAKLWFFLVLSFTYSIPYNSFLVVNKKNQLLVKTDMLSNFIFVFVTLGAIYFFGLLGAVIAAILGNFSVQIVRHIYARANGCPAIADKGLISVFGIIASSIIASIMVDSMVAKIGLCFAFVFVNIFILKITESNLINNCQVEN